MPRKASIEEKINPGIAHLARDVTDIREDPRNARRHKPRNLKAIADSLRQFGQQRALVALPDGTVIAGSGTLRAATEILGWKRIAVATFDGDEKQARAFALADNRSAELADWDYNELAASISALSEDLDLVKSLGWNNDELEQIARNMDVIENQPPASIESSTTARDVVVEEEPPRPRRKKTVTCPKCKTEFES